MAYFYNVIFTVVHLINFNNYTLRQGEIGIMVSYEKLLTFNVVKFRH